MWSQFFVERYASDKHQAYLREAAHDRMPRDPRTAGQRAGGRYRGAVGGAIVTLAVASAIGLGFAGVVARFTTTDTEARTLSAAAGDARPIASTMHVVDRWYGESAAATGTSGAHVADRWYDESVGLTGADEMDHVITIDGRGGPR